MARRKINIDPAQVTQMARLGMKKTEIAAMLDCDEGTIRKKFKKEYFKGRAQRIFDLRKAQRDSAIMDRDKTMLIWLGKNELEQSDQPQRDGKPEPQMDDKMG